MTDLCREFGISRKTGYKIWERFEAEGASGLFDESRRPHRTPHKTAEEVVAAIVGVKKQYPSWGGQKDPASARRATARREAPGNQHGARHSET